MYAKLIAFVFGIALSIFLFLFLYNVIKVKINKKGDINFYQISVISALFYFFVNTRVLSFYLTDARVDEFITSFLSKYPKVFGVITGITSAELFKTLTSEIIYFIGLLLFVIIATTVRILSKMRIMRLSHLIFIEIDCYIFYSSAPGLFKFLSIFSPVCWILSVIYERIKNEEKKCKTEYAEKQKEV